MKKFGIIPAIILILRNTIGTGIFMLPSILAKIGGISLIGWLVTFIGVIALGMVLAKLANLSTMGVGVYCYVKNAFGMYCGHQVNYIYLIAGIVGNVAMLSIISGYLADIFPSLKSISSIIGAQVIIVCLVFIINIKGLKVISVFQSISLILFLAPVVYLITFGWQSFDYHLILENWNISHKSATGAVACSFHTIMYSFIGIESAYISSVLIKNYKKFVPMATITGIIIVALLDILVCTVIMGIVPCKQLIVSSAPFALAIPHTLGGKLVQLIDICIIISCFSSLCGWTMITGQMMKDGALDRMFPAIFAKTNRAGIPNVAILIISILTVGIVFLTIAPTANQQFNNVLDISVLLYLIVYIYSNASLFIIGYRKLTITAYICYSTLAVIASTFCFIAFIDTRFSIMVSAIILTLSSTIFYWINKKAILGKYSHANV